jgi:hypothetical protein
LIWLAAICPSDPFDGFWAWIACSFLRAFGVDPNLSLGDPVYQLLKNPSSPQASGCQTLLESFIGPHQTCITEQLWQLMEPAGYVLVVVVLGARFAKLMASNNFSVSPGWMVADPFLRAVVASGFIHVSYGLMVLGHSEAEALGIVLFSKITAAGGVTGFFLLDPAGVTNPVATSMTGALLVDIIHWLFSVYVVIMILASLVGFQVCIVLAPLVIPLWVFSGNNEVFGWFTKTTLGSCALPIAVGSGWSIFLVLIHQFSIMNHSVIGLLAGWMMQLVFVCAGIWFMARFLKATTGELFSGHLLATMFYAQSVLSGSGKLLGGLLPDKTKFGLSQRLMSANSKGRMPSGLMNSARNYMTTTRNFGEQSLVDAAQNGPMRSASLGWVARQPWGMQRINQTASQLLKNANASLRQGDVGSAQHWLAALTKPREQEFINFLWRKLSPTERQHLGRHLAGLNVGIGDTGIAPHTRTASPFAGMPTRISPAYGVPHPTSHLTRAETQVGEDIKAGRKVMEGIRDPKTTWGKVGEQLGKVAMTQTPGPNVRTLLGGYGFTDPNDPSEDFPVNVRRP